MFKHQIDLKMVREEIYEIIESICIKIFVTDILILNFTWESL